MKFILTKLSDLNAASAQAWFKACVQHPNHSQLYFVPEEIYNLISNPVVDVNQDIVYEHNLPKTMFVVVDGNWKKAELDLVAWLANVINEKTNESVRSLKRLIAKYIKVKEKTIESRGENRIYNSWHNVYIYPGDTIEIDVDNDIMYVNSKPYKQSE